MGYMVILAFCMWEKMIVSGNLSNIFLMQLPLSYDSWFISNRALSSPWMPVTLVQFATSRTGEHHQGGHWNRFLRETSSGNFWDMATMGNLPQRKFGGFHEPQYAHHSQQTSSRNWQNMLPNVGGSKIDGILTFKSEDLCWLLQKCVNLAHDFFLYNLIYVNSWRRNIYLGRTTVSYVIVVVVNDFKI